MPQLCFRRLAILFFLPLWFTLAGCNKFEYSPNEVRLKDDELNLTAKNLARIEAMNLDQRSTVRFAVISDTQRFYDELDAAVDALKKRNDLDFVIITGDITDFGVTKEFRWINERMQQLSIPY
ncbi:MAG TPA: metallophosphoesterase, partial [Adhaeribacter sp.]|nr:metallophosphoesterase [Adhaeribacter sp.]